MPMDVDKNLLPNLTGDVVAFTFQDPDMDKNTVLEIDRDWKVEIEWNVSGPGAHFLAGADWHVALKIESMGPEEEKVLKSETVGAQAYEADSTPTYLHYKVEIPILARDLNDLTLQDRVNQEGVYRLIAILTHDKAGGFPGPDRVAGFIEGPMLQFYAFK